MSPRRKRQPDKDARVPDPAATPQGTPQPDQPRRYVATFQPEAWIQNNAVGVDPEGPTEWDCTSFLTTPALRLKSYLEELRKKTEHGPVVDTHDALKEDPRAPAWVRAWRGPFTILLEARPVEAAPDPMDPSEGDPDASPEPIAIRSSDEYTKEALAGASDRTEDALYDSVEGSIREAMNDVLDAAATIATRHGLGDVASEIRRLKDVRS